MHLRFGFLYERELMPNKCLSTFPPVRRLALLEKLSTGVRITIDKRPAFNPT